MKIAVVGLGYVGLSNAALLGQHNEVVALDTDASRVVMVNQLTSPILDRELSTLLESGKLNLRATLDEVDAFNEAKFIVIATPTNYDPVTNYFDTSSVESVVDLALRINPQATVVIKSTVPVGFTRMLAEHCGHKSLMFSPEFLREGKALYDNLNPSRIVVGDKTEEGHRFASLLLQGAHKENIPVLLTGSTEAEAIKLFSNTYLAMRAAYFNELDTYAASQNLNSHEIIEGVSMDPRVGNYYNNPSFGYGGYCLPKDTKQLLANYKLIPQNLISAIVNSNSTRKNFIVGEILRKNVRKVGIYRLTMKSNSDNYRDAAVLDVVEQLQASGVEIIVYEPTYNGSRFMGSEVIADLTVFKNSCDLIIANRKSDDIADVSYKVYTRDVYGLD